MRSIAVITEKMAQVGPGGLTEPERKHVLRYVRGHRTHISHTLNVLNTADGMSTRT